MWDLGLRRIVAVQQPHAACLQRKASHPGPHPSLDKKPGKPGPGSFSDSFAALLLEGGGESVAASFLLGAVSASVP